MISIALAIVAVLVVAAAALVTGSCLWTASRLRRLQRRCQTADAALRDYLRRRSSVAMELAREGLPDRVTANVLLEAATRARDSSPEEAWTAESDLTRALRLVIQPGPRQPSLLGLVEDTQRKASIARRIHNDAAALAGGLQRGRKARWLRLGDGSKVAAMIEFDDGMR